MCCCFVYGLQNAHVKTGSSRNVIAKPFSPARPVRPIWWMYLRRLALPT